MITNPRLRPHELPTLTHQSRSGGSREQALRFISQSNGKKDVAILERNTPHYLAW